MVEIDKTAPKKKMPKGGRKGGTSFPKLDLKQALVYSKKLVAKTHTGPLPEKTILPGVFGSATTPGKVRASALKQFGLLEGGAEAYESSKLAKDIDAAPVEEQLPLLQQAFRTPKLFNQRFETFQGDTVSKAKVEQRAKGLEVHPESAGECAQLFMDSAVTAGFGTMSGDSIVLVPAGAVAAPPVAGEGEGEGADRNEVPNEPPDVPGNGDQGTAASAEAKNGAGTQRQGQPSANKSVVTVNLTVDSSSDPDKLEKQLKLLKQFGLV